MVARSGLYALTVSHLVRSHSSAIARSTALVLCAAIFASWMVPSAEAGGIPCADNMDAICYGDMMGTTVSYRMIREEATTVGDSAPLFGMPTVSGNSIDFDPVGFAAAADGANDVDITDSNLSFMVEAKPGNAIQNIDFFEAGDTTLIGASGTAFTSVTASVFIDIEHVDGVPIDPIKLNGLEMVFTPSDGDYLLGTDGTFPQFQTVWTGNLFVDIEQALLDNSIPFDLGATKISVNLDNTLSAMSDQGTEVVIAKKDADGIIITTNIPEPASALLAIFGLALAATLRRRSQR